MFFKLALKNVLQRKSSFVIVAFVAFSIALFVITNSIFDSTENGIQEAYVSSFTGDIVIRPKTENPLSILGDETPVIGTFSENPLINPFPEVVHLLKNTPEIKYFSPLVSGFVALDYKKNKYPSIIFGIETEEYLKIMDAIKIVEGHPFEKNQKGMMISTQIAKHLNANIGSDIQFVVARGLSARIRHAPITAIYSYPVENSIFDEIVLISPDIARELLDITGMYAGENVQIDEEIEDILSDFDLDSMFEEASDVSEIHKENTVLESKNEEEEIASQLDETSWNFITCRVSDKNAIPSLIRKFNRHFRKNGWPVEAVNWRHAAGSNAMYLYFLRLIMNIGIFVILFAGFIVINNTLVINILDRTCEIGTMRALGSSKRFVCFECMTETMIISVVAGIIGCVLGLIFSNVISSLNITLTNSFLIQLFGGSKLIASVTFGNLLRSFSISLFIGIIAWIYPVFTAINTSPVVAMQGGK